MTGRKLIFLAAFLWVAGAQPLRADDDLDKADEQTLQAAHVGKDGPALLTFFRKRTLSEADRRHIQELIQQLGSETFSQREKAGQELIAYGTPALKALRAALADGDPEVVRRAESCIAEIENGPGPALPMAAARLLARRQPPGAVAVLLDYVPQAEEPAVEEEILAALIVLATLPDKVDPALTAALRDPLPGKRGAAAYVLGRRTDREFAGAVHKLLTDPEPIVRLRAAQGLIAGRDKEAVPVLIRLLADTPAEVAAPAEELLWQIAEEKSPSMPAGDDAVAARRKYRDAWADWWQQNAAAVDLARLSERPPYLNLTLVPEMHANKVWECGPDGKVRWEIGGLVLPIDAQVLPGGRVLIAELDGHRVAERDLKGTILWEKQINTPIACRRLPNGNTFIGTNQAVHVFDREGKEVFKYQPEAGFFIHSTQWQRNGHILCISMGGEVREIDATGKVLVSVKLQGGGGGWSGIESVPGGRYLVVSLTDGLVQEIDATGKVVWEFKENGACYASRLPNGNTLVVLHSQNCLIEVDRDGKKVWEKAFSTKPWRASRR